MPGFSTLSVGGTIVSPLRLNYDLSVTGSSTVAIAYSNAGITDIVGLQVVIYNNSTNSITLTAGTQFDNYTSYPGYCSVINQVVVPARQSITLMTTVIGQDYTIEAISGMLNLDTGSAGALVYQTAANRTGFITAGTANYILESNGAGVPPYWNQLTTGNLAGGVAGSLDYQSGPSATAKSAVGTAFSSGGGGMGSMLTGTSCGWMQTNFLQNGNANTYSGGTLTLVGARGYTISLSAIGGSSGNLSTYLTGAGIPGVDGNRFIIWNDTSANYTLTVGNIQNPSAFNANGRNTSFLSGSAGSQTLTIRKNETVVLQRYNSTAYTIEWTTQSIGLGGSWGLNSGSNAIYTSAGAIYDPCGWGVTGQTHFTPNVEGDYLVIAYLVMTTSTSGTVFAISKNGTKLQQVNASKFNTYSYEVVNMIVPMNGSTDYIEISGNSATPYQAHMAMILLN